MIVKLNFFNLKVYFYFGKCYNIIKKKTRKGSTMAYEVESVDSSGWLVSDPVSKTLVKNKNLLFSNLSKRMSVAQNVLFSLALLHVEVGEDYAEATFYREDVEQFIDELKYKNSYKERILNDIEAVGSSTILMFDEKMVEDPKNGKVKGVLVFSDYSYEVGKYHFTFNSSKTSWGGERITPILDILKRRDPNPVVYNLGTFSRLSVGGQVLYELLLLASSEGKRSLTFDLETLRGIFSASGKSMEKFNGIKNKHLLPAIESINKETELNVVFDPVKRSRTIVGATIRWSPRKVKLPVTEGQIALASELYVELLELYKNHEILERLKNISKESRGEAGELIAEAIDLKWEAKNKEAELEESISNKREFEQQKTKEIEQQKAKEEDFLEDLISIENQTFGFYFENFIPEGDKKELTAFFEKLEGISKQTKVEVVQACVNFEEGELGALLDYAYSIYTTQGKTLRFIAKILQTWQENEVRTLAEAMQFQKVNYGQQNAPKASKKSQKAPVSNIPNWSSMHPDNADKEAPKPTQEDMERLVEVQEKMGVFDTPKAIAEREKLQRRIDGVSEE